MVNKLDKIVIVDIETTCWNAGQPKGTHHRGVDDANNIAKILNWILN